MSLGLYCCLSLLVFIFLSKWALYIFVYQTIHFTGGCVNCFKKGANVNTERIKTKKLILSQNKSQLQGVPLKQRKQIYPTKKRAFHLIIESNSFALLLFGLKIDILYHFLRQPMGRKSKTKPHA